MLENEENPRFNALFEPPNSEGMTEEAIEAHREACRTVFVRIIFDFYFSWKKKGYPAVSPRTLAPHTTPLPGKDLDSPSPLPDGPKTR